MWMVVGGIAIYAGGYVLSRTLKVRSWPTTPGQVISREIGPRSTTGAGTGASYEPRVKYTYAVGAKNYTGDCLQSPGKQSYMYEAAKRFLDKIPDRPLVHYDPDNPANSCLYPSSVLWGWLILGLGVLTLLVALTLRLGRSQ